MYRQRRWLTRSLSDPSLPSSWTRRPPSFIPSSHLAPDTLRDTWGSDLPKVELYTQSTSTSPAPKVAANLAPASDLTDSRKHDQSPSLDTRVDAQRPARRNILMKDDTRAWRPADPARPSRHQKDPTNPTAHGSSKFSKKKTALKFDVPSLSNVYNPQFVQRLTPVNRRVPRHLRTVASFPGCGDGSSEQPTPRQSSAYSQTPPKKRKSDRKPSALREKLQKSNDVSSSAPQAADCPQLNVEIPKTPNPHSLVSSTRAQASARPECEAEMDMQATVRTVKTPVTPLPGHQFSAPAMEHADPGVEVSAEADQGEEPVPPETEADPEPAISQMDDSRDEIDPGLEVETIIELAAEAIVEAVIEIAEEPVASTAVGGGIELEAGPSSKIAETMDAEMDINPGHVDPVDCGFPLEDAAAEERPSGEEAAAPEHEFIQGIAPQKEAEDTAVEVPAEVPHPIESKTVEEETPHITIRPVEAAPPHPKEQFEPTDTATPYLPGTKSIGSTTTAVESKRPESLAETLYERSIPGTQKSDLRSRSRAKSRVEETDRPVEPTSTTAKDQIPTSIPPEPAPAPQAETKPKPSEPKQSGQQKRTFAAPGDDFDTDNEPSWAWEELLKQIDEEDRRYQEQRNAVDVNMWWIGFELAWEANLRKGRPLRTWLDVEKNWPRIPEWERDVKESEVASDPSRIPKKIPDQSGEKSSQMKANPSVPAPGATTTNPSPHDGKRSAVTSSASSTRTTSSTSLPNPKEDKDRPEINPRRSSQGGLKGDIWTMWKETEQRWAEEERIEKEKANPVKPAPAPTAHEPPRSTPPKTDSYRRSRYSRRSDHPISSTWQERVRQQEEGRTGSGRNTQQSQQQSYAHSQSHTNTHHSQQQQSYAHQQAHVHSEPYSQWRRRQSSAAQTGPAPPPPQPNTSQPSGYQSRRDTGTQSRPTAHHKKEPRVPLKIRIPETPMGSAWKAYEARWESLLNSQGPISFASVPWPTHHRPADPTAITIYNIAAFLLSPEHSKEMSARDRLRGAVRRWHTDKFTRFASRIIPEDKGMIDEGVGIVARALTQLLELDKRRTS